MDENVAIDTTFKCGDNFHDVRNCVVMMSAVYFQFSRNIVEVGCNDLLNFPEMSLLWIV